MGWRVGMRFDGSGVGDASAADTIQIRNNIFGGNVRLADSTGTGSFAPQQWLQTSSYANSIFSNTNSVQLTSPFNIYPDVPLPADNVNNWIPLGGSPALSGCAGGARDAHANRSGAARTVDRIGKMRALPVRGGGDRRST